MIGGGLQRTTMLIGVRAVDSALLDSTAPVALSVALPDPGAPLLVPPATAAAMLGMGKTSIHKLMKSGVLRSKKIGRSRRIFVSSIVELANAGIQVIAP